MAASNTPKLHWIYRQVRLLDYFSVSIESIVFELEEYELPVIEYRACDLFPFTILVSPSPSPPSPICLTQRYVRMDLLR